MPKTTKEKIFFTAITAFFMVYVMTVYNTAIAMGNFTNNTFVYALKGMWIEYFIMFLLAYYVSGNLAKAFAFRIVEPTDRQIYIILAIQLFTVVFQVAFASVIGVWHGAGFTSNFIPDYFRVYCRNFIFALFIQLLIVGPLARWIFRSVKAVLNKKD